jgi:hypothetical protein
MAPDPIRPEPEPATVTGRDLAERFGDRWQIAQEHRGVWSAERRSTDGRRIRVIIGPSAAELADKLEAAEVCGP